MIEIIISAIVSSFVTYVVVSKLKKPLDKEIDQLELENILREYEDIKSSVATIRQYTKSEKIKLACSEIDEHIDDQLHLILTDLNLYSMYDEIKKKK